MSQTAFNRPVEGGAAVSWMIHAAKGKRDSGEFFKASEINMVRNLFDRAYAENGGTMIRDLKYRIREGERSAYELSQVAPNINWYNTDDALYLEGPANPTVFTRAEEAGELVSWMNATAYADGDADYGEINRISDFFRSAHQEFGYSLIRDLEDRIYEGEIARDALRRIAPGYF